MNEDTFTKNQARLLIEMHSPDTSTPEERAARHQVGIIIRRALEGKKSEEAMKMLLAIFDLALESGTIKNA